MAPLDRRNLMTIVVTLVAAALITLLPFPDVFSEDGVRMLAIALVGGFGFSVWIYQTFTGPPGPPG